MSYKTTVVCSECGKEQEVPQLNALPKNWITMGFMKTKTDANMQTIGEEPVIEHFCGWHDCYKYVRRFVKKEDES